MRSKISIYSLDYGDSFWYIGDVSRVYCYYLGNSLNFYEYSLETGNIFLTKEEAKIELKKRKIIAKIKKYCYINNIPTEFAKGKVTFILDEENNLKENVVFKKCFSEIGFFDYGYINKILWDLGEDIKFLLLNS